MIKSINVIDRLPFELQARLLCDPFFADIPVVVFEKGNIAAELARRQGVITQAKGKRGVAVIVLQCLADDAETNLAFGPMKLRSAFQVVENVELNHDANGTGLSARTVARQIVNLIKPLRLVGLTTDFVCDSPCIEPVTNALDVGKNVIVYQVNFATWEADAEQISMCSMPQFAAGPNPSTPTLLLSTGTPGATIWYTTDDTYPAPTDKMPTSTAQVYTFPIPVPLNGFTVRCLAAQPGWLASQVNRAEITVTQINTEQ